MPVNVCIVLVTYNRCEVLIETLHCLSGQKRPVDRLVVVDNGSTDDTIRRLRTFTPGIDILELGKNVGYGAGLSQGMKYAAAKYTDLDFFWLMDDDSQPDSLLLEVLLAASKTLDKPGIVSVTGFTDTLWHGPVRIRLAGTGPVTADHVLVDGALVDLRVVNAVGTPREDLFMMCEDLEYSKRIRRGGFGVFVLPEEALMSRQHLGGGSKFSTGTRWRGYYHARNHLAILKDYFSWWGLCAYGIRQTKYLVAGLIAPDRFKRISLRLLGILHGLTGKMGKIIDPADIT